MDSRKKDFEDKKNFLKKSLQEALFTPLVKAKNQLQNYQKHLKQKRCLIRHLNLPNFYYFSKKLRLTW